MKNSSVVSCGWSHCKAPASKHVHFAKRFFAAAVTRFTKSARVEHRNLCDSHVGEVRRTYFDVSEQPLALTITIAADVGLERRGFV